MNNNQQYYIGIDIGGSSIKFGIFSTDGICKYSSSIQTQSQTNAGVVLERISHSIETCLLFASSNSLEIASIGIGIPGVVLTNGVVVTAPNFKDFTNVDVKSYCESKFSIPLFIDNDATVAGLAEAFLGSGAALSSFLFVTLGTGVGGCIIYNGEVFRGVANGAGEVGHIIIYPDAETIVGKPSFRRGVLEEYVGREGIVRYATETLSRFPKSYLTTLESFDVADISYGGNTLKCPHCLHIIGYVGKLLGIALSTSLHILDIHTVIIGGGIAQFGDVLFYTVKKICKERCIPSIAEHIQILPATYSNDSGMIGAAYLAKQELERLQR
jgi:glucokinase